MAGTTGPIRSDATSKRAIPTVTSCAGLRLPAKRAGVNGAELRYRMINVSGLRIDSCDGNISGLKPIQVPKDIATVLHDHARIPYSTGGRLCQWTTSEREFVDALKGSLASDGKLYLSPQRPPDPRILGDKDVVILVGMRPLPRME
jgi:hypothetical protein